MLVKCYLGRASRLLLGKEIDLEQCKEILKNAKKILNSAIKSGGTTLKLF